jgi:drug/metabolite transporter (DMT)-like permease
VNFPTFYFLPLAAGFIYALGALLLKRAYALEAGLMRSVFVANLLMGITFGPLILLGDGTLTWESAGKAIIVGITFFLGQIFTFVAMRVGDVSVATSILGTKVIFVALTGWVFFREAIPLSWWMAAFVTAVAIFLLGISDPKHLRHHLAGIAYAVLSAAFFGLTDGLLPVFAADADRFAFLSIMFGTVAVLSFGLVPFFNAPLRMITRRALPWLFAGTGLLALQSLLMAMALAFFGQPTAVNILYSGRGLWALLFVLFLARFLQSTEGGYGWKTMSMRWSGAVLLVLAIFLVLVGS